MKSAPHFLFRDLFSRRIRHSPLEQVLRESALFSTLTRRELRLVRPRVYERTYQAQEAIFDQGDRGFGVYLIARGRVGIETHAALGDTQITTLETGSFFGELALIDPSNLRSARAIALEPTLLLGFFKADLADLMERHPSVAVKILYQLAQVLSQRLLESTDKINLLSDAKKHGQFYGETG